MNAKEWLEERGDTTYLFYDECRPPEFACDRHHTHIIKYYSHCECYSKQAVSRLPIPLAFYSD